MEIFKIKSLRMLAEDPDIEFSVTIDAAGNLTPPYPVKERKEDFAMMLTREEFLKETGEEFWNTAVELIPVAVEYGKYRDIQRAAVALGGKLPKTLAQEEKEEAEKEKLKRDEKRIANGEKKQMTAAEERELIRCKLFDAEDAEDRYWLGLDCLDGLGY